MKNVLLFAVLTIFSLALITACSSMKSETTGEYIDDSTMHTQISAIIVKDKDARYFKIDVTVTQGDVLLKGFVNSRETEERVIDKIREIKGVKSINSLLRLKKN